MTLDADSAASVRTLLRETKMSLDGPRVVMKLSVDEPARAAIMTLLRPLIAPPEKLHI